MYTIAVPPEEEITDWFNIHVAEEYVQDGRVKNDELDAWINGGGLYEGISLYVSLLDPIDIAGTNYQKGYRIKIYYSGTLGSGSFLSSVVYDGSKWLWYGNREWGLGLGDFVPRAEMVVDDTVDNASFSTGFRVIIWDKNSIAYQQGARSAIVTGPGLPDEGLKLAHNSTEPYFSLYSENSESTFYPLTADEIISAIPDNAEYVINFYSENAETVSLNSTNELMATRTSTLPGRPLLNSELNPNLFPVLITPVSHDLSAANIGGSLDVRWTNPSQMIVDSISLGWIDENGQQFKTINPGYDPGVEEGATIVTFDTTGYPPALFIAQMYLQGSDAYGRSYSLTWPFSSFP